MFSTPGVQMFVSSIRLGGPQLMAAKARHDTGFL
jgi:hypothetical protein